MLEKDYYVIDNSWINYPTASSPEKIPYQAGKTQEELEDMPPTSASELEDILIRRILSSLDEELPESFALVEKYQSLLNQAFEAEQLIIAQSQEFLKLTIDKAFRHTRLWLLDPSGQKRMSGFFDLLLIDKNKQSGVVMKYYFGPTPPVFSQVNKELEILAIIASEAFSLEEVCTFSTWIQLFVPGTSISYHYYDSERLRVLSKELHTKLKLLMIQGTT